ncbi:MAG: hypothetical protein AABX04_01110 [Nanoarchaeota archaeon]
MQGYISKLTVTVLLSLSLSYASKGYSQAVRTCAAGTMVGTKKVILTGLYQSREAGYLDYQVLEIVAEGKKQELPLDRYFTRNDLQQMLAEEILFREGPEGFQSSGKTYTPSALIREVLNQDLPRLNAEISCFEQSVNTNHQRLTHYLERLDKRNIQIQMEKWTIQDAERWLREETTRSFTRQIYSNNNLVQALKERGIEGNAFEVAQELSYLDIKVMVDKEALSEPKIDTTSVLFKLRAIDPLVAKETIKEGKRKESVLDEIMGDRAVCDYLRAMGINPYSDYQTIENGLSNYRLSLREMERFGVRNYIHGIISSARREEHLRRGLTEDGRVRESRGLFDTERDSRGWREGRVEGRGIMKGILRGVK